MNWPMRGLIVRLPPRRLAGDVRRYHWLQYDGTRVLAEGRAAIDDLPGSAALILLLAAEDVVLTRALVPPLSGQRLREALPNLVEDMSLADPAQVHVAMGTTRDAAGRASLAMVERAWLRGVLERFAAAGQRVAAVLPEALCVPLADNGWTLVREADKDSGEVRCCVRTGSEDALALPGDGAAAQALLALLVARAAATGGSAPRLDVYGSLDGVDVPGAVLEARSGTALRAWIEQGAGAQQGVYSLLQHEFSGGAQGSTARRWRRVAVLVLVLLAVQLLGMQWRWQQLRAERVQLQADMTASLRALFPETTVILDVPLQMAQGLARLRAAAGRSDPGDFVALAATAGQVFASLPPNAAHAMDYAERVLRLRLAPGMAADPEVRRVFIDAALAAGYELRFEEASLADRGAGRGASSGASGGTDSGATIAVLRVRGGR